MFENCVWIGCPKFLVKLGNGSKLFSVLYICINVKYQRNQKRNMYLLQCKQYIEVIVRIINFYINGKQDHESPGMTERDV